MEVLLPRFAPASADKRTPAPTHLIGVSRSWGMSNGVARRRTESVTEPTLSGTDVLRQLLTLGFRTPSCGRRQAVKEIAITAPEPETGFTLWRHSQSTAYDFYCAAACACADSIDPHCMKRPSRPDTTRRKKRVPARPGLSDRTTALQHALIRQPPEATAGAARYGVRVAFRLTPE